MTVQEHIELLTLVEKWEVRARCCYRDGEGQPDIEKIPLQSRAISIMSCANELRGTVALLAPEPSPSPVLG